MPNWTKWPIDERWKQLLDDEANIALPLELPNFHRSSNWQAANNVIDLGCGNCTHLLGLASEFPGKKYSAIDIDENAVKSAIKNVSENTDCSIDVLNSDLFECNGNWDAAIARLLVQHLSDLSLFLNSCKKILRQGGTLIVIDSDEANWLTIPKLDELQDFFDSLSEWREKSGYRRDSVFVLEKIANDHSFEIITADTVLVPTTVSDNKNLYFRIMLNAIDVISALYDFEWDFPKLRQSLIDWHKNEQGYAQLAERFLVLRLSD